MEFCKLTKEFSIPDYKILEVQMSFMEGDRGIAYHYADLDNFSLFDIVPEQYKDYFTVTIMRINAQIPPHTDSGIKSTINIYINTDDCVTQFYKFKNTDPATQQVTNQTDGFIFNETDLEKTNSFVAEPNQAWLLDVSQPHAVIPHGDFNERTAIAISSTLAYNVVQDILKETGNL
jgi:hypothetical protein